MPLAHAWTAVWHTSFAYPLIGRPGPKLPENATKTTGRAAYSRPHFMSRRIPASSRRISRNSETTSRTWLSIDRCVIAGAGRNTSNAAISASINTMVRVLGFGSVIGLLVSAQYSSHSPHSSISSNRSPEAQAERNCRGRCRGRVGALQFSQSCARPLYWRRRCFSMNTAYSASSRFRCASARSSAFSRAASRSATTPWICVRSPGENQSNSA